MSIHGIDEETPYTDDEKKVIAACHEKLGDRMKKVHQLTLIRYVRGFAHEEEREAKTVEYLTKHLDWREEEKVDELLTAELKGEKEFRALWQSGTHGTTKTGHVIYVERFGQVDPVKLQETFEMKDMLRFHIQQMERLCNVKEQLHAQTGKHKYKHIAVLDLQGLGWKHMSKNFYGPIKEFINIDQYMYPETLLLMFVVNYPWIIKGFWNVISPWIDPLTRKRIIWGKDELTKYCEPDQIPRFLGGKCACPEGKCLLVPFPSKAIKAEKKEAKKEETKATS